MSDVIGYQFDVKKDYLHQPVSILCGSWEEGVIGDLESGESRDTAPAIIGATVKVPYLLSSRQYTCTGNTASKQFRKMYCCVTLSTTGGGAYDVDWEGYYKDYDPEVQEEGVINRTFYLDINTTSASDREPPTVDVRNYWRCEYVNAVAEKVSVGADVKQDLLSRSFSLIGTNNPDGVEVKRKTPVEVDYGSYVTVNFKGVACVDGRYGRDDEGHETSDGYSVFVHDEYVGVEVEATNVLAFPTISPCTVVTLKGNLEVDGYVRGVAASTGSDEKVCVYYESNYKVEETIRGTNACKTIEVNVALPQMKLYALCTGCGFCNTMTTGDVWKLIEATTSGCTKYQGAVSSVCIISDGDTHESTVTFTQNVEVPESRVLVMIADPEEMHRNAICGLVAATFCQGVGPYEIYRKCTATDGGSRSYTHSQEVYGASYLSVTATVRCVEVL